MRVMAEPGRRRFAQLPAIHERQVLSSVVRSAMLGDSWPDLLPLVPLLPRDSQLQVWSEVLAIADQLSVDRLQMMANETLDLGVEDMLPDVVAAAEEADLWERALRLLVALGPGLHRRLTPLVPQIPPAQRAQAYAHAREMGVLEDLGPLGGALLLEAPTPPGAAGERIPDVEEPRDPALEERATSAEPSRLRGRPHTSGPLSLRLWVRV